MTAAEKLKALEYTSLDRRSLGYALVAALPQILAVVEAAEAIVQAEDDWDVYAKTPALADALSALDEALDNGAEQSPTAERT